MSPRPSSIATLVPALFWMGCCVASPGCGSGPADPPTSQAHASELEPSPFDAARAWEDLQRIVGFGPRPAGSQSLERLRAFLEGELAAVGLEPVRERFRAETPIGEIEFVNLWAELAGTSERTVVLGSHMDTKRLPFHFVGANDGGSSTAGLLELARVLAREPSRRAVTYRFVFFDGEESIRPDWGDDDSLYGSRHHVAELQRTGGLQRIGALVLLDLIADRDLALERDTNSDRELQSLFFAAAREMGHEDLFARYPREILDDHLPFRDAGIPAIDLIDLNYGPANSYWHSPDDLLRYCSPDSMELVGRLVLQTLPALENWVLQS